MSEPVQQIPPFPLPVEGFDPEYEAELRKAWIQMAIATTFLLALPWLVRVIVVFFAPEAGHHIQRCY